MCALDKKQLPSECGCSWPAAAVPLRKVGDPCQALPTSSQITEMFSMSRSMDFSSGLQSLQITPPCEQLR